MNDGKYYNGKFKPKKHKLERYLDNLIVDIYISEHPAFIKKYELILNKFESDGYKLTEYKEILNELKGEYLN